jgi:hypothetical protein
MTDVMQRIRVPEVAEHPFVPAASALLTNWGADARATSSGSGSSPASSPIRVGVALRHDIDNIAWGCDYRHSDCHGRRPPRSSRRAWPVCPITR